MRVRSIALLNAHLGERRSACVRIENGRITSVEGSPRPGDLRLDLEGDRLLPGLINSHDHLQLNGLPRLKYRETYENASDWIDDIRPRLQLEPMFLENHAVPREERLLLGGVKNLLSGVTTVAHHDPLHPSLLATSFPIRVVRCGWAHSLAIDGEAGVRRSFESTPGNLPWIVHAAEGTDAAAESEFARLDALGCIAENTVLVHGMALNPAQHRQLSAVGAGLVWCPSSNQHLFHRTIDTASMGERRYIALGSDSRISGASDLLAEVRLAHEIAGLEEAELEAMVTRRAARILRLADRGAIRAGAVADLIVIPSGLSLVRVKRTDIDLVLVGGEPRYAAPRYADSFEEEALSLVELDDRPMYLSAPLVNQLRKARMREPGLLLAGPANEAAVRRQKVAT